MPQRDQKLYIEDILDFAEAIKEFTKEMLKDFRNFIVHEYFGVDAQIVWDLATQELDELVSSIGEIEYDK